MSKNAERRKELFRYPYNISNVYRDAVVKMADSDENLKSALINNSSYSFSIRIEDLFELSPKDEMRPSRFVGIKNYLEILGIHMIIIPRKRRCKEDIVNLITLNKEDNNE